MRIIEIPILLILFVTLCAYENSSRGNFQYIPSNDDPAIQSKEEEGRGGSCNTIESHESARYIHRYVYGCRYTMRYA